MTPRVVFFGNAQSAFSKRFFDALLGTPTELVAVVDVPPAKRSSTNPRAPGTSDFVEVAGQRGVPTYEPASPNEPGFVEAMRDLARSPSRSCVAKSDSFPGAPYESQGICRMTDRSPAVHPVSHSDRRHDQTVEVVAGSANGPRRRIQSSSKRPETRLCISSSSARPVAPDGPRHVDQVRASELDWTIVRIPMLRDGRRTGIIRVGWVGVNVGTRISREDVADFMLAQLTERAYLHGAPVISN